MSQESEVDLTLITSGQYDVLIKLMRGDTKSPASRAARLVLVDGISQADAMRETGASRTTVHLTVKRYSEAYELIKSAFMK